MWGALSRSPRFDPSAASTPIATYAATQIVIIANEHLEVAADFSFRRTQVQDETVGHDTQLPKHDSDCEDLFFSRHDSRRRHPY